MKYWTKRTIFFIFITISFFPLQSFGANFGIKPAYPRADNPRTESIFSQTLNGGESAKEAVRVINNTNETKHLLLYAKDSAKSSGGGFACDQLSQKSVGVGGWITFDLDNLKDESQSVKRGTIPQTIDLFVPAGQEIIIPFTIKVPAGVSVGEHNGCVLVQELKEKSGEAGMSLSLRSGLRVAINVPGIIERNLTFSKFNIEKRNGSIYLMPTVKNTGNVSVDTDVSVKVKYFFGLEYAEFGGNFPVLRDQDYDFSFELKKPFWGGFYNTQAVFSYDKSTNAGIGIDTGEKMEQLSSGTIWFFSTPTLWGLILEIIILLFLLFLIAIYKLNKRKKLWIKKWVPYTISKDDTIEKIARIHRIHWDLFTEVNNIKPPYILKEGQSVLVPPKRRRDSITTNN